MSEDFITITSGREQQAWPVQGQWSYENYLTLIASLEDGRLYELINGRLYITNPQGEIHDQCVAKLRAAFTSYAHTHKQGHTLTSPFRLHLSDQARPLQPDLFFTRQTAWPSAKANYFKGVPDLIVEVLGADSYRTDQLVKFQVYEQAQVPEYWLVNPFTQSIQLFTLANREYQLLNEFLKNEELESRVLPQLKWRVASLF